MSRESHYFSSDEYKKRLDLPKSEKNNQKNKNSADEKTSEEKVFETANDCRKFETTFFWQRGTYYWAFILASFTAHFACLGNFFDEKAISFSAIKNLPDFSLLTLAVTAFFCFFFSWSWVIVNKGSRFWQQNWENHIDALEKEAVGHLFRIVMNEHNTENCSPRILSCKPYRYSLAKTTQMTGIVLMVASFIMLCLYIFIFTQKFFPFHCHVLTALALLAIVLFLYYLQTSVYSKPKMNEFGRKTAEWYMA